MEDVVAIGHDLKRRAAGYTVDRLKGIITGLNDQCGGNLGRTGRKSELVQRIYDHIDYWVDASWNGLGDTSIRNAKAVFESMDAYGSYNLSDILTRINDVPAILRPTQWHSLLPTQFLGIPFKFSPFFKIDQHISLITVCPESASSTDRRSVSFDFMVTFEQRMKLASQFPKYEPRLYCTSSAYYTKPSAFQTTDPQNPVPIEFPNICEIRVNNVTLSTRDLGKMAGIAPPVSIARQTKTSPDTFNKVEMIYWRSHSPNEISDPPKKYFLQVNLVQVTTSKQLFEKVKTGKYRSKEEVLAIRKAMSFDDDDIIAGPQKVSLKCPLGNMRISTPIRSAKCLHVKCFDGLIWLSMMEIATTWQCPVCERRLRVADLVVDGYIDSILKETPDNVEDVMVEADGAWHTLDNKFHSVGWTPPTSNTSTDIASRSKPLMTMTKSLLEPSSPQDNEMDLDSNTDLTERLSESELSEQDEFTQTDSQFFDDAAYVQEETQSSANDHIGQSTPSMTDVDLPGQGSPPEDLTDRIHLKKRIGSGGNSDVWHGTLQTATGEVQVAIKELRVRHYQSTMSQDERLQKRFHREMLLWNRLRHCNIVPLLGYSLVPDGLPQLISPWYSNGTVIEYLRLNPDVNRLKILHDVAQGLNYLHLLPLVHGDIKGDNVLVNEDGVASLCDFGLAKFIDDAMHATGFTTTTQGNGGTVRFLCPELLEDEPKSTMSDIWAFGCLIIQIMTGQFPYADLVSVGAVQTAILRGRCPLPIGYDFSEVGGTTFWDAVRRCWEVEPRSRPTIAELLGVTQQSPTS